VSDVQGYELRRVASELGEQFISGYITDMECLTAMRALKRVFVLVNRRIPRP
jgi:hypothetical protein